MVYITVSLFGGDSDQWFAATTFTSLEDAMQAVERLEKIDTYYYPKVFLDRAPPKACTPSLEEWLSLNKH